jgi:hypothetical protein
MKFNLLLLLPLALSVSAGVVGRGDYGDYGYPVEKTVTETVTSTTTATTTKTSTTTKISTTTTSTTETVTSTVTKKYGYPEETYYAS